MEAAVAAEQVVDQQEHQARIEHHQRGAAQRFHVDQVQVGRDHQVADEFAVLRDPHRADRDFGAAAQEVEQADPQIPGETLVDDLERRHAAADDALLRGQVVRAYAARFFGDNGGFFLATDALQ